MSEMKRVWVYRDKLTEKRPVEESIAHVFGGYEHSSEELSYIIGNLAELLVERGVISGPEAVNALRLFPYHEAVEITPVTSS